MGGVRWSCAARALKFLLMSAPLGLSISPPLFTPILQTSILLGSSYPVLQGSQLHAHYLPVSWSPEQCFGTCRLLHQWPGIYRRSS